MGLDMATKSKKKNKRTKLRHQIIAKFLSGFIHQNKKKKKKGSRKQIAEREINES